MFDDFELESANLSKSDFRPNPTKSLKPSQSRKIPKKKSSKSSKPIQLCSIKNDSVLPNTIHARKSVETFDKNRIWAQKSRFSTPKHQFQN